MSTRKNTRRANSPQPLPQFVWPKPGEDIPRLPWVDWLRFISLDVANTIPGAPGTFVSQHILALAEHARVLGATDPESHERLAQAEADRESAWIQALEAEAAQPGIWSLTDLGDADEVGGWGGHLCEDAASQYWIANDPGDETWSN